MPVIHKQAKTIRIMDFLAMLKPRKADTAANTKIPIKIPAMDSPLKPVGSGINAHNIQPSQGIMNTEKQTIPALIPHVFAVFIAISLSHLPYKKKKNLLMEFEGL